MGLNVRAYGGDCRIIGGCPYLSYLSSANEVAFRVRNANSDTVAYVDTEGNMRLRGIVFENFEGWGLWARD